MRRIPNLGLLLCLLLPGSLLLAPTALAQPPVPVGPEIAVSDLAEALPGSPDVAVGAAGWFFAVWESDVSAGSDGDGTSIQGRLFASGGMPLGEQFQVNVAAAGNQGGPAAAAAANGDLVAVWRQAATEVSRSAVVLRRFAANGSPLGAEVQVVEAGQVIEEVDVAAAGPLGDVVVAWSDRGLGEGSVLARRYSATNAPAGPGVIVSTAPGVSPVVAAAAGGGFAVAWGRLENVFLGPSRIVVRLFDAAGKPRGDEIEVSEVGARQESAALAVQPDGSFAVGWASEIGEIRGQRFGANGTPVGGVLSLSASDVASRPQLAPSTGGGFVAAWQSTGFAGESIRSRAFSAKGEPLGPPLPLSFETLAINTEPALAGGGGSFVAAWIQHPEVPSGSTVQARLLRRLGECVPTARRLCLAGGRFAVEAEWSTVLGTGGAGNAFELTPDTGYFTFDNPANVEAVVKVIDACEAFDRFWVFAGGLTNVRVDLLVTDTETGEANLYTNPQQTAFAPIQDSGAFATCP